MCGIAGFTQSQEWAGSEGLCRELDRILEHRGPNDRGRLLFGPHGTQVGADSSAEAAQRAELVLVHRRLAILDLSKAGWQPMSSPDGRYHIVYNGEIYNYLELRDELMHFGVQFHSGTDTEVLLQAFIRWGGKCLKRFVGMFAFVVFDQAERTLFLARDFFGIKPLYYAQWKLGLAFASEIKALLAFPGIGTQINARRLYEYLRHGRTDDGGLTLFDSIRQLPAGHFMKVQVGAADWPSPQPYWSPDRRESLDLSFEDAAKRLRELFVQSVTLHLRSDVQVGACLSGGVDSSAIVHAMREIGGRKLELHTFTYVDSDQSINEERWAEVVNRTVGAHPHKIQASQDQFRSEFGDLIAVQDEPFLSTSIYAQYCVFRAARRAGMTVMLDGQGADEILAGYPPFIGARVGSLLRQGCWARAGRLMRDAGRLPGLSWRYLFPHVGTALMPGRARPHLQRWVSRGFRSNWLQEDWLRSRGLEPTLSPCRRNSGDELLKDALEQSLVETSLPCLLRYEDRNSMAFSIESRVPFLTPQLVDFVYSLPEEYILGDDGTTKRVFRAAMRELVPDEILNRRDKIGFATAELRWLAALRPWIESVLSSETARSIPAIRCAWILGEFRRRKHHDAGFGARLWRVLNLIEWSRQRAVDYGR